MSKLVKNQKIVMQKMIDSSAWGRKSNVLLEVTIRHDDECGNGHNTFSITGGVYSSRNKTMIVGGCIHDTIAEHFPELAPFIKWHLTSTDGPLHYIANTTYHAKNGDLGYARSSAVWFDATLEQLQDEELLHERLPVLMKEFQHDVESLGLEY